MVVLRPEVDINTRRKVEGININQGPQQTLNTKTCGWMLLLHSLNLFHNFQ